MFGGNEHVDYGESRKKGVCNVEVSVVSAKRTGGI